MTERAVLVRHQDAVSVMNDGARARARLSEYFRYLREVSPHYRQAIDTVGRKVDADPIALLGSLPTTEKHAYRTALREESLESLNFHHFVTERSSGSSAQPVVGFYRTADDLSEQEATEAALRRVGMRPEDHFVCMDFGAPEIYDFYFRASRNLGARRGSYLHLTADFRTSTLPLRRLAPSILLTIPTLLVRAWPFVRDFWTPEDCPIRALIFMGEPMHDAFRECVERAWSTSIHSFYGTTETGGIGTECALGDGVHFDPREILLTLENPRWLDDDTVEGEVLFTTTGGHTHNVVKYRVGDRLRVTTAECPCGETTPRLWHRERTNDAFMIGGEKFRYEIFVEAFREVDPSIELLSIYVEDGADENAACRLRVVVPESARDCEEELYEALKYDLFELGAFHRYRLVEFLIEFQPLQAFSKRKVDRVVDRRRYICGHPDASAQSPLRPAAREEGRKTA